MAFSGLLRTSKQVSLLSFCIDRIMPPQRTGWPGAEETACCGVRPEYSPRKALGGAQAHSVSISGTVKKRVWIIDMFDLMV